MTTVTMTEISWEDGHDSHIERRSLLVGAKQYVVELERYDHGEVDFRVLKPIDNGHMDTLMRARAGGLSGAHQLLRHFDDAIRREGEVNQTAMDQAREDWKNDEVL